MEPPADLEQWACGLCDSTAAELSTPTHPPLDGRSVIRAHVLDAHNILLADLEASQAHEFAGELRKPLGCRSAPKL
jgi:hypothetical protein